MQGIDYAKLAAEAGGKPVPQTLAGAVPTGAPVTFGGVDYAKLAQEAGGVPQGETNADGRLVFKATAEKPSHPLHITNVLDALAALGIGAAKGLGRTAVGAARLMRFPSVSPMGLPEGVESALGLDPANTGERIGMGVEQAAEFLLPGGALRRAPAVVALAKKAPAVARAVAEAAAGAGVSAVQGGDVTTSAALGAAGPVVGKAVSSGARAIRNAGPVKAIAESLNKQARTQIDQALAPTTRRMKAKAARVTPQIQKRLAAGVDDGGMAVGSREDILADATTKADELGKRIDDELTIAGKRPVDLAGVRRRISAMKGATFEMVPQPNGPAKQVIHDPRKYAQIEKLEGLIDSYGDSMNVRQATAIRRTWDDIVQRAGGFDDKAKSAPFGLSLDDASEASVVRDGVEGLRKALAKAVPEVRDINREFGFWADLRDVLQATQLRQTGQSRGMFRKMMSAGGTAAGAVVGSGAGPQGAAGGAVLAGVLADRAEKLFASPQWKLLSAKHKTKLADAIASGNEARISNELGRIGQLLNALRAGTGVPAPSGAR